MQRSCSEVCDASAVFAVLVWSTFKNDSCMSRWVLNGLCSCRFKFEFATLSLTFPHQLTNRWCKNVIQMQKTGWKFVSNYQCYRILRFLQRLLTYHKKFNSVEFNNIDTLNNKFSYLFTLQYIPSNATRYNISMHSLAFNNSVTCTVFSLFIYLLLLEVGNTRSMTVWQRFGHVKHLVTSNGGDLNSNSRNELYSIWHTNYHHFNSCTNNI